MTNKGVTRVALIISMILLLVAVPIIAFCAPEEEKVVKIGQLTDLTGPAATSATVPHYGLVDYLNHMIEKEGGIDGIKVELIGVDVQYDVSKGISAFKRFVEEGCVITACSLTKIVEALKPMLADVQIPMVSLSSSDAMIYPPGWIYCHTPTYTDQFAACLDWFLENRWEKAEPPVMAMVGPDNSYGKATVKDGTRYAREKGIEEVYYEWVPYVPVDLTPQLLRLKEAGVNFVWSQTTAVNSAPLLKDA